MNNKLQSQLNRKLTQNILRKVEAEEWYKKGVLKNGQFFKISGSLPFQKDIKSHTRQFTV